MSEPLQPDDELFKMVAGAEPASLREGYLVVPRTEVTYAEGTSVPVLGLRMAVRPSGLIVPASGVGRQMAEISLAFMTASTFMPQHVGASAATTLVAAHPAEPFLAECATIMALIRDPTISRRDAQLALVETRLSEEAQRKAKALLQENWAFLAPQAVLGVMKLAFVTDPSTPREAGQLPGDVTMASLILADNLERTAVEPGSPLWQDVIDQSMAIYLIQNQLFNHLGELGIILARWRRRRELAHEILPDLARTFDDLFEKATGTTPDVLLDVGFGILLHLQSRKEVRIGQQLLASVTHPATQVSRAIGLIAADFATLRDEVNREISNVGFEWASNAFRRYPILRTSDDSFLVLDPSFLSERICGSAFFWEVFNYLKQGKTGSSERSASELRGDLGRFMGLVAEEYAYDRLKTVAGSHGELGGPLWRESVLQEWWPGSSCCDFLIDAGHAWIAIDVVSHRVSVDAAQSGSLEALEQDLEYIVDEKARQIDVTIANLIANGGALPGEKDRDPIPRYHPVIIASAGFPWNPFTSLAIQARLKTLGLLQHPLIGPLTVLTIEDLEHIESAVERGAGTLVEMLDERSRASSDGLDEVGLPFDSYLDRRSGLMRPTSLNRPMQEAFAAVAQAFGIDPSILDDLA